MSMSDAEAEHIGREWMDLATSPGGMALPDGGRTRMALIDDQCVVVTQDRTGAYCYKSFSGRMEAARHIFDKIRVHLPQCLMT